MNIFDLPVLERETLVLTSMKAKPYRWRGAGYNKAVDMLSEATGGRSYNACQWIYTNLAVSIKTGYKALRISLKASYWTGNDAGIGYRQVKRVIDYLEDNGFIVVVRGGQRVEDSYQTIIKFTKKMYDTVDLHQIILHTPKDSVGIPVVLKDRKQKNILDLPETNEVERMIDEMVRYNDSVSQATIQFNGQPVPLTEYKRSFSGAMDKGGRLYVHGGGVQLLKGEYRTKYLTIDGSPVKELDYKAHHAMLLYEAVAMERDSLYDIADAGFDPYSADSDFIAVDNMQIHNHKDKFDIDTYDPVRNLYKQAFMSMVNCDSYQKARNSLNQALYEDWRKDERKRKFVGIFKPDVKKVLDSMTEHNHNIEQYFYRDFGVVLQNWDSEIALKVIDYVIQSGNTCLCYHDSFTVKESVDNLLRTAMIQGRLDIMKSNKFCYVEEK